MDNPKRQRPSRRNERSEVEETWKMQDSGALKRFRIMFRKYWARGGTVVVRQIQQIIQRAIQIQYISLKAELKHK